MAIAAIALSAASSHAAAGQWLVCTYSAKVMSVDRSRGALTAKTTKAIGRLDADCPRLGETLEFAPETMDYQTILPFRAWPKKGAAFTLIYRHLDGICKNRGPCRIKHFSVK